MPFEVVRPATTEEHLAREMPRDRALRLSGAKAKAVAAQRPDAVVIGSDQVASLGSRVLDKPGDAANCRAQLAPLSGQTARFHTGCAVIANGERPRASRYDFGPISSPDAEEIERYVEREKPFDCAGGFKVEALGITSVREYREPRPDGADRPASDLAGERAAQRRLRVAVKRRRPFGRVRSAARPTLPLSGSSPRSAVPAGLRLRSFRTSWPQARAAAVCSR